MLLLLPKSDETRLAGSAPSFVFRLRFPADYFQGHIYSLSQAAAEADFLIVGINSDASTKRLKGESRPIHNEKSRSIIIASLVMVDAVIIFEEDTPFNLINTLLPDVLVKGGDYTLDQIVGAKEVMANGGRVVINKTVEGFSTTGIIDKLK